MDVMIRDRVGHDTCFINGFIPQFPVVNGRVVRLQCLTYKYDMLNEYMESSIVTFDESTRKKGFLFRC